LIDARELHEVLGVKTDFWHWFNSRVKEYDFTENVDFFTHTGESNVAGGRPEKSFFCVIGMAKELAMLDNGKKGRQIRRHLIEVEGRYNALMQGKMDNLAVVSKLALSTFGHIAAGLIKFRQQFNGSLSTEPLKQVIRMDTEKGGRVYLLWFRKYANKRILLAYDPQGNCLSKDGGHYLLVNKEELPTSIDGIPCNQWYDSLEKRYMDKLGKWGGYKEGIEFDDYIRWREALLLQSVDKALLPGAQPLELAPPEPENKPALEPEPEPNNEAEPDDEPKRPPSRAFHRDKKGNMVDQFGEPMYINEDSEEEGITF
jgi:phage anti-repressor protein